MPTNKNLITWYDFYLNLILAWLVLQQTENPKTSLDTWQVSPQSINNSKQWIPLSETQINKVSKNGISDLKCYQ